MKNSLASLTLALSLLVLPVSIGLTQTPVLEKVELTDNFDLGIDDQLWGSSPSKGDKKALLSAINYSLNYLNTEKAKQDYQNYPIPGITRDRVRRSLLRFKELLIKSKNPQEFKEAIKREFYGYKSIGKDGQGTVSFTGYYEPVHQGSLVKTDEFKYPLYRLPPQFKEQENKPTRVEIEGKDGLLGESSPFQGYELVWLKDRLEAYLIHIQGSAKIKLPDGKMITVGYAGSNDYPYVSLGKELIQDGIIPKEEISLPRIIEYFQKNPEQLSNYIPRNNRFIFFKKTVDPSPLGRLGVPLTPDRSIATDKSMMPPGAIALIHTPIPYPTKTGELETRLVSRYVLDQDTGSAIIGPGRVDIFLGTGQIAGDRAGIINWTGELYYLLLKE